MGDGVGVEVGVDVSVGVAVAVDDDVAVAVALAVDDGVAVAVAVAVHVEVAVGLLVRVGVGVAVGGRFVEVAVGVSAELARVGDAAAATAGGCSWFSGPDVDPRRVWSGAFVAVGTTVDDQTASSGGIS